MSSNNKTKDRKKKAVLKNNSENLKRSSNDEVNKDLKSIDQQEGNMNNGTKGGNFSKI